MPASPEYRGPAGLPRPEDALQRRTGSQPCYKNSGDRPGRPAPDPARWRPGPGGPPCSSAVPAQNRGCSTGPPSRRHRGRRRGALEPVLPLGKRDRRRPRNPLPEGPPRGRGSGGRPGERSSGSTRPEGPGLLLPTPPPHTRPALPPPEPDASAPGPRDAAGDSRPGAGGRATPPRCPRCATPSDRFWRWASPSGLGGEGKAKVAPG